MTVCFCSLRCFITIVRLFYNSEPPVYFDPPRLLYCENFSNTPEYWDPPFIWHLIVQKLRWIFLCIPCLLWAHHGRAQRKIFEMSVVRWLKNAIFILDFANTAFPKRAMLLAFYVEYTEVVLDIPSYLESTMVNHVWTQTKFSN